MTPPHRNHQRIGFFRASTFKKSNQISKVRTCLRLDELFDDSLSKTTGVVVDISENCKGSIRKFMERTKPDQFYRADQNATHTTFEINDASC